MRSLSVSEVTNAWGGAARARAVPVSLPAEAAKVDARLVRDCLAGDERAFEDLVSRHRHRLMGIVSALLHNHADAEEVVDDTFLRAYRGLRGFRGDASVATWLNHIAANLARNRYWYRFRRRSLATSLDAPLPGESGATLGDFAVSDAPDPVRALKESEFKIALSKSLELLPPRHRKILELRGVLDRSYAQIARALGVNVGTVKSRIARARTYLRRELHAVRSDFPLHKPRRR